MVHLPGDLPRDKAMTLPNDLQRRSDKHAEIKAFLHVSCDHCKMLNFCVASM